MGMFMSFLGKEVPSAEMFNMLTVTLYNQFMEKDVKNFECFHSAILDLFGIINSALPGQNYDVPSCEEIEECFREWQESSESERKNVFVNFMKKARNLSKLDDCKMIAGTVTPSAAMAAKNAVDIVPWMRIIKAIPDVIFVPSVIILALISAKLSGMIFQGKTESSES